MTSALGLLSFVLLLGDVLVAQETCASCKGTGSLSLSCGLCEGTGYLNGRPGQDGCTACGGVVGLEGKPGKRGDGKVRLDCPKCALRRPKGKDAPKDPAPPPPKAALPKNPSFEDLLAEAQAEKRAAVLARADVDIGQPEAIKASDQRVRAAEARLKELAAWSAASAKVKALALAIESAGREGRPGVGNKKCNLFVGDVGRTLGIPYFNRIVDDRSDDGRLANEIHGFVAKAAESKPSGWRAIDPKDAQALADRGEFVVAVARSLNPAEPGHVAIVAPSIMAHDHPSDHKYPWVRDNVAHDVSRRANYRFDSLSGKVTEPKTSEPLWVVWEPSPK